MNIESRHMVGKFFLIILLNSILVPFKVEVAADYLKAAPARIALLPFANIGNANPIPPLFFVTKGEWDIINHEGHGPTATTAARA